MQNILDKLYLNCWDSTANVVIFRINSYRDGRVNLLDIIVFRVFFLDSNSLAPIGPPSPGLIFHDGSDAV